MKFVCDVHISYKVQNFLQKQGYIALHINEVLDKWITTDIAICQYADENDLIIITKDFDFVDFYHIRKSPRKLLKITLGNIATNNLIKLISEALPLIHKISDRTHFLIEIDKDKIYIVDEKP